MVKKLPPTNYHKQRIVSFNANDRLSQISPKILEIILHLKADAMRYLLRSQLAIELLTTQNRHLLALLLVIFLLLPKAKLDAV